MCGSKTERLWWKVKSKKWKVKSGFVLLAIVACAPGAQAQSARPNIVVIMMDDLGYGDIGSYGVPDAQTPNIDRLAREGVKMTDFYANGANCSPTRAGFITGRYQQRVGIENPLGAGGEADLSRGLVPTSTSLPALLKTAGYSTGLIGKWHLGWDAAFHPNRHGFDEFWGFMSGGVYYYDHSGEIFHNGDKVSSSGYLTDEITVRARQFVEDHHRQPFFLEVAYNATHWPFQGPGLDERARARPDWLHDGTRADYVAMLESADRGVGVILDTLGRLQLARNTFVIFTSDNGGEWLSRNAPLFHRKSTLWEGGIRVPALLRWPAQLPANITSKQVAITMDLTASILAAAGVRLPESYRAEGINLLPLLAGRKTVERTLFWRIKNPVRDQKAVRRGRWKYLQEGPLTSRANAEFIFDLEQDPGERRNMVVERADLLPGFRKSVAEWEADVEGK
jgi:arylsulfatase A-like enzyme